MSRLEALQGDITKQAVDAIVNAANTTLLGGGGVDGAIHRAAGPELLKECRRIGGCPTGEAGIRQGHGRPAKYGINPGGPVWAGGQRAKRAWRRSGYATASGLPPERGLRPMAFPPISRAAYPYP